ncbi:MAG: DUF2975 domain-containing protein, partial [Clostridiales bacterium]|nr:DUF2975 domain-containing protein [Clostridiales bacterium]
MVYLFRMVLVFVAAAVLIVACWVAPEYGCQETLRNHMVILLWPCLIFTWVTGFLLLQILILAWKICSSILREEFFTGQTAGYFQSVRRMARIEALFYLIPVMVLSVMEDWIWY